MARRSVRLKLVVIMDSTRTDRQLANALEPVFDELKDRVRARAAQDPQTSIVGWHIDRAAGSVDEPE